MATWYLDPVGGNDSNAGTSFANRKLTLGSIVTAGAAAGDSVRIIGSPDATSMSQNATFTNGSLSVTLTTAVTVNITNCDSAWTATTNVTASTQNLRKEGSKSCRLAIASAFTTGIAGYFNTGTIDLSSYQQVSFWIQANASVAAGVLKLLLSTTTNGGTATHEFTINQALTANTWTRLTFDNGSNMNSAIASVALVAISDPGVVQVYLDNILACKASSAADSLTLNSLFGINSGTDGWWAPKSINGTTVVIDTSQGSAQGAGQGYTGTTATTTIYKRECMLTQGTQLFAANGTAASPITISGGWDRTAMSTQNLDRSFINGSDDTVNGWQFSGSFLNISRLGAAHYNNGLVLICDSGSVAANVDFTTVDDIIIACGNVPISANAITSYLNMGLTTAIQIIGGNSTAAWWSGVLNIGTYLVKNSASYGLNIPTMRLRALSLSFLRCGLAGLVAGPGSDCLVQAMTSLSSPGGGAISPGSTGNCIVNNLVSNGNTGGCVNFSGSGVGVPSTVRLYNASIGEGAGVTAYGVGTGSFLLSDTEGGTATNHVLRSFGFTVTTDTGVKESPAAYSWRFDFYDSSGFANGTYISQNFPASFPTAPYKIYIAAGKTLTFTARVRRTNTGVTARIRIKGGELAGIASDVTATAAAGASTWETLTVTATPTNNAWIEIWPEVWNLGSGSAYFGLTTAAST